MPESPLGVRVAGYDPRWRDDFARLNLEWLERWFTVEPLDRQVLGDPEGHVLAGGGRILFAVDGHDQVVGTVALKHDGAGVYELTKMAVDPTVRGSGIGRLLVHAAIDAFVEIGGHQLFLESNSRLEAAVGLYESVGFVHTPAPGPAAVARADVYMVWQPDLWVPETHH